MTIKINVLKASHGDSIVVTVENDLSVFRLLIDGGPRKCFQTQKGAIRKAGPLKNVLDDFVSKNVKFDMTILTHVDDDHIAGLLAACQSEIYRPVVAQNFVFNSGRVISSELRVEFDISTATKVPIYTDKLTSIAQGVDLDELLYKVDEPIRTVCVAGNSLDFPGGAITILSPELSQLETLLSKWDRETSLPLTSSGAGDYGLFLSEIIANDRFVEDTSVHNISSIAFLLKTATSSALFLGDAIPSVICRTLRRLGYSETNSLNADICKLSHHGSKANTSQELISLVNCKKYIVSTDGKKHNHPNKTTLARLLYLQPECEILFNYPELIEKIFTPDEIAIHGERLKIIDEEIIL